MRSCWVNVKSGRQLCRLESQAGADPAVLRQNFFLLQEASGFALRPSSEWTRPPQCYSCILSPLGFALTLPYVLNKVFWEKGDIF